MSWRIRSSTPNAVAAARPARSCSRACAESEPSEASRESAQGRSLRRDLPFFFHLLTTAPFSRARSPWGSSSATRAASSPTPRDFAHLPRERRAQSRDPSAKVSDPRGTTRRSRGASSRWGRRACRAGGRDRGGRRRCPRSARCGRSPRPQPWRGAPWRRR
jgi:hypothetical protein